MNRRLVLVIVLLAALAVLGLSGWSTHALAQGGTATATITSPTAGATVSGTVPISGTAMGPNFAYYVVQLKQGDQWLAVDNTVHTALVTRTATLASWDTTQYVTAAFDLRLLVVDTSGQFITSTVSVKVDNTKFVPVAALPNRGCTSCHTQIAPDGRYTIAWEAMNADPKHPTLSKGFQTTYQDCMVCHASKGDTGIAGVVAPLAMRAILHPAHMTSEIFTGELHGTCFSCHEVDNGGNFMVLPNKVNVNQHGVQTSP